MSDNDEFEPDEQDQIGEANVIIKTDVFIQPSPNENNDDKLLP